MKRVLSVGQCNYDHGSISRFLQGQFGAEVIPADTSAAATEQIRQRPFDLVLVNRKFDADGSDGLGFIESLKADPELAAVPVMLVTNFPEYAEKAVALGALPGFGKVEVGSPDLASRLRPHLATD
jgi:two-component system chemotaxis response regulator CheY